MAEEARTRIDALAQQCTSQVEQTAFMNGRPALPIASLQLSASRGPAKSRNRCPGDRQRAAQPQCRLLRVHGGQRQINVGRHDDGEDEDNQKHSEDCAHPRHGRYFRRAGLLRGCFLRYAADPATDRLRFNVQWRRARPRDYENAAWFWAAYASAPRPLRRFGPSMRSQ